MSNELKEYVNSIAEVLNNFTEETNESGEHRDKDGTPTSVYTWAEDCLDVEFVTTYDGSFKRASFLVSLGGPTVWVDTSGTIRGYWGGKEERAGYSLKVAEQLGEYACDLWDWR